MNILMFTNTFTPHVGGVARSVQRFTREFRRQGHRVVVVAPEFEGMPETEVDVVRLPAIRHFSGSDFSVPVPLPGRVSRTLKDLGPQVIHSHHPFLLGETALRVAASHNLPVVFTHHTLYERYTHYLPGESPRLQRFALELATGYGNLCDAVIAPSRSVADLLADRGVKVPVEIIPTGVDLDVFSPGEGTPLRTRLGLPPGTFLVGHVGRLAEEKNLPFLARSVARFMGEEPRAHFLLAGTGPAGEAMCRVFEGLGLGNRQHRLGVLGADELVDAYRAMDVFAFASQTETQGMVLAEAMAVGIPVVAVDGPGVRELVRNGINGRLLPGLDESGLAEALAWVAGLAPENRRRLREAALHTAGDFSIGRTAGLVLSLYRRLLAERPRPKGKEAGRWAASLRFFGEEWKILRNLMHAVENALKVGENGKNGDL
jgi:1,2-diacylglycerol 3-alpha-glucosyltransferase